MSTPVSQKLPKPAEEHAITEEEIRKQEIFELESPDHSLLSGPGTRIRDLGTIFRVAVDFLRASARCTSPGRA